MISTATRASICVFCGARSGIELLQQIQQLACVTIRETDQSCPGVIIEGQALQGTGFGHVAAASEYIQLFFRTGPTRRHVGVYVGDGRFVHASNEHTGVRIDHLSNRYYAQRFEGGQTLLD